MEEAPHIPRVAILPTPGMGHLIPLTELALKLVHLHNFTITFLIPHDDNNSQTKPQNLLLESLHPSINSIFLPPVDGENFLDDDAKLETRIYSSVIRCLPSLREALSQLTESTLVSAFVVDMFGAPSFHVAEELGIAVYLFFTGNAMGLSFAFHLPELDRSWAGEYRDLPEPVKLPGCVPVHGSDFVDPVQDRTNDAYQGCVEMCRKFPLAKGILVNSFLDLEPETFRALEETGSPFYPVGPLVRPGSTYDEKPECLKWLDSQPTGSVLFVSFGSGGTLSREQLKELALGLEMSEQRFLLVARSPHDKVRNAAYFTGNSENKMKHSEYLSTNFMERIKEKGFVVSQWAPQIEVLSHPAVGGFLTHCGWNSTLESIVHGIPLIAWPLFTEQRMNAVLLSEDLKVAMRVRENENGVVESEQISKLARNLIEGDEGGVLRERMSNLKDAAAKALSAEGSSTKCLANVAAKWIMQQ